MGRHLASAVERQNRRMGAPVTVRRKVGALDPVTSKRTSATEIQVETAGFLVRPVQRSAKGDPLSTEEAYYQVPIGPFRGVFTPQDGDLVIDSFGESRVLSVRTHFLGGQPYAYRLYVSGVARAGAPS